MPKPDQEFVSVYANGKSGTVVTVSAGFAKATGQRPLRDEPAVDRFGAPLPPRQKTSTATSSGGTSKSTTSKGGSSAASKPEEASK